jgi:monofunctional biosynthetic peptidoglycan transglycosylase
MLLRGIIFVALALLLVFVALVSFYAVEPPVSTLMAGRKIEGKSYERFFVRLKDVAPVAIASIVASEDSSFCRNDGVDWSALREVLSTAGENGPKRGASTITMQTAKNLFLWPGRSAIRKGVEIGIALVLGAVWSKTRTMEIYLNIAEWGDGLYGIEAASRRYFHKRASQLDAREAALLATSLPNPIKRDPAHPSLLQVRLAAGVIARARGAEDQLDCLRR